MWAFIWLGLIVVLVVGLLFIAREERHQDPFNDYQDFLKAQNLRYNTDPLIANQSELSTPLKDYTDYEKTVLRQNLTYNMNKLAIGENKAPTSYTVDIVNASKIAQPPCPPCTGFVDEAAYAPTDTNADIARVKAELATLRQNIPNYVMDGIREQTGPLVKRALREQGCPLTDDRYGAQA